MYRPRRRCIAEMKTADGTLDPLTESSGRRRSYAPSGAGLRMRDEACGFAVHGGMVACGV